MFLAFSSWVVLGCVKLTTPLTWDSKLDSVMSRRPIARAELQMKAVSQCGKGEGEVMTGHLRHRRLKPGHSCMDTIIDKQLLL